MRFSESDFNARINNFVSMKGRASFWISLVITKWEVLNVVAEYMIVNSMGERLNSN